MPVANKPDRVRRSGSGGGTPPLTSPNVALSSGDNPAQNSVRVSPQRIHPATRTSLEPLCPELEIQSIAFNR